MALKRAKKNVTAYTMKDFWIVAPFSRELTKSVSTFRQKKTITVQFVDICAPLFAEIIQNICK